MCNDVKNIISHGFETCYDWRPVLELLLESASENYFEMQVDQQPCPQFSNKENFFVQDIERRAEQRLQSWLTSFQVLNKNILILLKLYMYTESFSLYLLTSIVTRVGVFCQACCQT